MAQFKLKIGLFVLAIQMGFAASSAHAGLGLTKQFPDVAFYDVKSKLTGDVLTFTGQPLKMSLDGVPENDRWIFPLGYDTSIPSLEVTLKLNGSLQLVSDPINRLLLKGMFDADGDYMISGSDPSGVLLDATPIAFSQEDNLMEFLFRVDDGILKPHFGSVIGMTFTDLDFGDFASFSGDSGMANVFATPEPPHMSLVMFVGAALLVAVRQIRRGRMQPLSM